MEMNCTRDSREVPLCNKSREYYNIQGNLSNIFQFAISRHSPLPSRRGVLFLRRHEYCLPLRLLSV